ncbi:MAG: excinuclease ABC subunit UvrC [Desulfonauticus sp.]|nr:excinuclease ABC subunit UvrC [Desulfonauticus sp.]
MISKDFLATLPPKSGVYLMKDGENNVLYVGKAKNLAKRVRSYFQKNIFDFKVKSLISQVKHIDFIITNSEKEALLLEANLIKKYKPKYNIYFRDDKQYILIILDKQEKYPSLKIARRPKAGCVVFGPYPSSYQVREIIKLINKNFKLRKCGKHQFKNRMRPCLQYHLNRCFAPCCYDVDYNEYQKEVQKVELFLKGKSKELINVLKKEMQMYADNLEFEKAAFVRDKLKYIKSMLEKQNVVNFENQNTDIFYLKTKDDNVYLSVLSMREGKLIDKKNFNFSNVIVQDNTELWSFVLIQFYLFNDNVPDKIVISDNVDLKELENIFQEKKIKTKIICGQKKYDDFFKIAEENLLYSYDKKQSILKNIFPSKSIASIESLDVSHFYGNNTYLGSVYFEDNKFVKEKYRLYKFDNINRNDFLPYKLFLQKKAKYNNWPDLFLIDGGLTHLDYFLKQLRLMGVEDRVEVLAISKGSSRSLGNLDDKIYSKYHKQGVKLAPGDKDLLLLQKLRDEAHRFVLSKQRQSRSKEVYRDVLSELKGIGPKTASLLWEKFKTLDNILRADIIELQSIPGIGYKKALFIKSSLEIFFSKK